VIGRTLQFPNDFPCSVNTVLQNWY